MIALNEPASWSSFEIPAVESERAEMETDFEDDLIALLCRLEHLREKMVAARAAHRLPQMLALAVELIDDVKDFSHQNCGFSTDKELDEARRRAKDFSASMSQLRENAPIFPAAPAFGPTRSNETSAPMDMMSVRRSFAAMHDAVMNFFIVFTNRFPSSLSARSWVDVAATFLVELKHLTQEPMANV
jgi:hypothetical protein